MFAALFHSHNVGVGPGVGHLKVYNFSKKTAKFSTPEH